MKGRGPGTPFIMHGMAKTLVQKILEQHHVCSPTPATRMVYVDRIFLHERTGSVALQSLADAGRSVRHPRRTFCTMDHIVSNQPGRGDEARMPGGEVFITATRKEATRAGIHLFDIQDHRQGIVHVISPELGIAVPGITLVCPDSHTCTLGGLGALAWGIGSTDAEHAMATQTLVVAPPKMMRVNFEGTLAQGVSAKDMILKLIGSYGASGGVGYAVEFAGPAVRELEIEARLTLCNMGVEFGAWTAIIAPDEKTFEYVAGRPFAPEPRHWEQAVAHWSRLHTDPGAVFDKTLTVDCSSLSPQITWGTSPMHVTGIDATVPDPQQSENATTRAGMERALRYMGLTPGMPLEGLKLDGAFIGSCTNSRLSDLRLAAKILAGRRVADGVKAICVPGSQSVKRQAEAEGLHHIFQGAGFQWGEPGCAFCFYAGGETFAPESRVITSTNRNFEGRQGPAVRSHLASPASVAASAVAGQIVDVRNAI